MRTLFERLFVIFLAIAIALGTIVVVGQLIGLVLQRGDIVSASSKLFAKPAFIFASLAGLTTFVMSKIGFAPENQE